MSDKSHTTVPPMRMFDQHGEVTRERWLLENILSELKAIHATLKEQKP